MRAVYSRIVAKYSSFFARSAGADGFVVDVTDASNDSVPAKDGDKADTEAPEMCGNQRRVEIWTDEGKHPDCGEPWVFGPQGIQPPAIRIACASVRLTAYPRST
jgi:hypothetical protein